MSMRLMLGLISALGMLVTATGCGSADSSAGGVTAQIDGAQAAAEASASGPAAPGETLTRKTGGVKKASLGDPEHPIVDIQTSAGKITLQLDAKNAPGTVRNFLNYVNGELYNQTVIHYVDAGGMVLAGGFDAQLNPIAVSPPIRNEAHNGLKNLAGTIAMSRPYDSIDGATSQFYLNVQDNPALDHQGPTEEDYGYCVFGKVTAGLDVVERISQVPVHTEGEFTNTPKDRVLIESIRFVR